MTMPPSAAPPPTFEAKGKFMKAAKAAFNRGDYDEAIAQGQRALTEDANDRSAKTVIENALNGQKAELRFRAAENALRANDFEKAVAEANAGRDLASWDPRAGQILVRIQEAQRRAAEEAQSKADTDRRAQLAQQINGFIGQGDAAITGAKYDEAIAAYDQALRLDGSNQRALSGKSSAVQARALAQATGGGGPGGGRPPGAGRSFAAGKTVAASTETKPGGSVPDGFDVTPGVPKPGERYRVKVFMVNEGNAPIQVRDMFVSFTINGKKVGAPVPPQVRDVAPQQKALMMDTAEAWKEDTTGWAMEVTIRTARGEKYTNQVTWK
jgi:predicted negative regulator of RcsB-dependent stress response